MIRNKLIIIFIKSQFPVLLEKEAHFNEMVDLRTVKLKITSCMQK